jgi:hypothetical protein
MFYPPSLLGFYDNLGTLKWQSFIGRRFIRLRRAYSAEVRPQAGEGWKATPYQAWMQKGYPPKLACLP